MFSTLGQIFRDNWEWRGQIWRLAVTELQKEVRGAALGWIWLILTPAIWITVFWFGLVIGLRTGSPVDGVPYLAWLAVGIVPWFFMSNMLSTGTNVYRRYPYLVNRVRFPRAVISSFYATARFVVFLATMVLVAVVFIVTRVHLTIYAVQAPFIAILMLLFWATWSLLMSPLSALSKDFHNLLKAMTTPLFWLSGTIFNVARIKYEWIKWVLAFNPITFFVTSFRAALCEDYWVWNDRRMLVGFLLVFVVVILAALRSQARLAGEIADVL